MKRFKMAPEIHYENGAVNHLYNIDFSHAFVVTDHIMEQLGLTDKVIKILDDKNVPFERFSEVEPNPSVKTITRALEIFLESDADILIAIGGGSVIDAAKAIIFFLQKVIKQSGGKRKNPFFVVIDHLCFPPQIQAQYPLSRQEDFHPQMLVQQAFADFPPEPARTSQRQIKYYQAGYVCTGTHWDKME